MSDFGHEPSASAPFPERLGRYEVLLPIASGGMATVYLACSTGMAGFEREVALKLTHAHLRDSPEFVTALIDEARLAGRIRHPNVVSVLDVAEDPEGLFIIMDYVEGESLAGLQRILKKRDQRLPLDVALRILDDILEGLHAAHELTETDGQPMHLVHRDVTPHNVLVGLDGISRLTDFGVAKAVTRLTQTASGLVKGKVAYMAPEQAEGIDIDRRCDVWAAGVVAWELFSGTRLHDGLNDAALMLKITREPPMSLRYVRPDLPREIADVVARALMLDPRSRYPTAEAFSEALSSAAQRNRIAIADFRGVKAFVNPLIRPSIEARRQRVAQIRATRPRLSDSSQLPINYAVRQSSPHAAIPQAGTVAILPHDSGRHPPLEPHTGSDLIEARDQTGSTFETRERVSMAPTLLTASYRWWYVPVALLPIAATISLFVFLSTRNPRPGATPSAAAPVLGAASAPARVEEPAPSASVISLSELAVESAPSAEPSKAPPPRFQGGRRIPAAPAPAAEPTRPGVPLGNPYNH